jgi:hypothetical protein
MLLFVSGVRPLTWPMISMSTSRPMQAFAVPKKRMVEPFMNSRHCARLSIVPGMATATSFQDIRGPSKTVGDGSVCMDVVVDEPQHGEGAKQDAHRLFGSIARGAQRTTCSRIPLSSWQFVRNRKHAVDEATARSPGARMPRSKSVGERGSLPIA